MGLILIIVIVVLPIAVLVWRFTRGGEPVGGGSLGRQIFRRKDDDWGPKPS